MKKDTVSGLNKCRLQLINLAEGQKLMSSCSLSLAGITQLFHYFSSYIPHSIRFTDQRTCHHHNQLLIWRKKSFSKNGHFCTNVKHETIMTHKYWFQLSVYYSHVFYWDLVQFYFILALQFQNVIAHKHFRNKWVIF